MRLAHLARLNEARAAREAMVLITPLGEGGEGTLLSRREAADHPLADALRARLASGKSGRESGPQGDVFVRVYRPAPRLVAIGAVHVSQVLAPMAEAAGFAVTIVDPRTAFASPERFAGLSLIAEWPEADVLKLDPETAVATLTHDPKIDDPALTCALEAGCFYVGALGSRKTHAKRVERLTGQGFDAAAIGRIHAPIGLAIGAATPAEIAVSVLSEIIKVMRTGAEPAAAPQRNAA